MYFVMFYKCNQAIFILELLRVLNILGLLLSNCISVSICQYVKLPTRQVANVSTFQSVIMPVCQSVILSLYRPAILPIHQIVNLSVA